MIILLPYISRNQYRSHVVRVTHTHFTLFKFILFFIYNSLMKECSGIASCNFFSIELGYYLICLLMIFYIHCHSAGRPDRFSLAVHHGGIFVGEEYVGGMLNYVDNCTIRQFELLDLSSIVLKLGYRREYICEFYYCHPSHNQACHGTKVGHPLEPLIDEEHLKRFKKLANKLERIVHVYVLEITEVEARARKHKDQEAYMKDYFSPKSKGVVIEEIDEPPLVVSKQKPLKKAKVNPGIPLLEWYEQDVEFEDYLVSSLAKAREEWRKKEVDESRILKFLMDEFSATVEQVLEFRVLHVLLF